MNKKILIGSIIAVAIIVLSSFSSVVGKVSLDEELVELDVEFSGLGKKHKVKLTQQEADEVELLFDEIHEQLNEVESREEAEVIFKDAVVELDKYGLLGRLSIRQAQRLITRNYKPLKELNLKSPDDNSNFLCLIAGDSGYSGFFSLPSFIRTTIAFLIINWILYLPTIFPLLESIIEKLEIDWRWFCGYTVIDAIILRWPWHIGGLVSFGRFIMDWTGWVEEIPASGWVRTFGLMGMKTWEGEFYGQIARFPAIMGSGYFSGTYGFIGVKIHGEQTEFGSKFLGSALWVKIGYEPPDI